MTLRNRDINESIRRYMPEYYEEFTAVQEIIGAEAGAFDGAFDEIRDVLAQFYLETATWGLAYWEDIFGIRTDEDKPLNERRSVIRSQKRGQGTVTKAFVREVAESYDGGEVEVTEEYANYNIVVTFISTRGVPPNLEDTKQALRNIVPAHLTVNFEFTYLLYSELASEGGTYADVAALGLTYEELKAYKYE
ncbi:putative phage tail protein [Salibacterium lacus]|uniref:Phage tail protein n=1 Tax=Salibacterium lacus TaxID=1898109 RepID=A0ABW5SY09_9BACI